MKKNKKIKKIFFSILTSIIMLASSFNFASAEFMSGFSGNVDIGNTNSLVDEISSSVENKYNINEDSVKEMMQNMNVSQYKSTFPQIMLFFDPSTPKDGEKMTAHANPMYFSNPKEKLYFTWYVKHDGCDLDKDPSKSSKALCDADGDGEITVNDWKVEAMRALATSGYSNQDEPLPNYKEDGDSDEYKAYFGGDDKGGQGDGLDASGEDLKHCYIADFKSGKTYEFKECAHLFSKYPSEYPINDNKCPGLDKQNLDLRGASVGDKEFNRHEECFWGTNPQDPNTAGNGNLDEANATGLGRSDFSWTYQQKDLVGVIVEGTGISSTKYANSSYMTMWALAKNKFYVPDSFQSSKTYCQPAENSDGSKSPKCGAGYFDVTIPTISCNTLTSSCNNKCDGENCEDKTLEENLVDPAEKTNERLDVSLSSLPQNPTNDSSGDQMGDVLSVNAIVNNASQDSSQLKYEWKIEGYSFKEDEAGYTGAILQDLFKDGLISGGKLEENGSSYILTGLGLSSINIKMNLGSAYEDYFFNGLGTLKIGLTVKEAGYGKVRIGKGESTIKINSTGKKIKAYLTTSDDGEKITSDSSTENSICNSKETDNEVLASYICPVVKNQILKLEIDNDDKRMTDFAWTVNGDAYTCDSDIFGDVCSGGNVIFLPMTGNVGDEINVKVTGKDFEIKKNTEENDIVNKTSGKALEVTKSFEIVKPFVTIVPGTPDIFWPKALGVYTDLEGRQYTDDSESLFETYNGVENVLLKAEFHPDWLPKAGAISAQWIMDNEIVTDSSAPQEISFNVTKDVGEGYGITFNSYYSSSTNIRRMLKNYWGVTQDESEGEILSASIRGTVIAEDITDDSAFLRNSKNILASIISNFPSQSVFLLRMALVVFVVVLMSGLAFNLSPDFQENKK